MPAGGSSREGTLRAGFVASPHGLDGSFHVAQADPQLLQLGGKVTIHGEERHINRRSGHDRRVILRVEGCDDRDSALLLRGAELLVDRSLAPARS